MKSVVVDILMGLSALGLFIMHQVDGWEVSNFLLIMVGYILFNYIQKGVYRNREKKWEKFAESYGLSHQWEYYLNSDNDRV